MSQYDGPRFAEPDEDNDARRNRREEVTERREDVHIRNYDFRQGYDLDLTVSTETGTSVLDGRFYFQPGAFRSLENTLEPGRYEVTVRLDDGDPETTTCEVDDEPDGGLLIELGNGQVSVTEGIYI